jgi:heme A synthase
MTMKLFRLLSLVATVETFLVVVMGKIVRVTGAGTSIPD